jgi:hypothetical protein
MEEDRFHLLGLKDGAWYIISTSSSREEIEDSYSSWHNSDHKEFVLSMVVKVL